MEPENLTLRVLVEMRDEMRGMREDQRHTNARLESIEGTLVEAATQLRVLARATRVTLEAKASNDERVDDLERRVIALERERQ